MADVLVVDDDPDTAEALRDILELAGHAVRVAYDGAEGLREARARAPEVAVLDVDMPVLDGPGMAYGMFVHDMGLEEVPVVLLSGAPDLPEIAERVGTPYRLAKPCTMERLLAMVDRALAERTPPCPGGAGAGLAEAGADPHRPHA